MGNINYTPYLNICHQAVASFLVFKTFRRNSIYSDIVGGISCETGQDCVEVIKDRFGINTTLLNKFAESDSIGQPIVYYYEEIRQYMSPATMRYIRTLIDLLDTFGDLSSFDIVEIGGGYGGQCKIIHDLLKPKSYTIVDLPEVLELTKKYLDHFKVDCIYREAKCFDHLNYDLCISNYSYSEINKTYQKLYKSAILSHSKKGYIICNGHVTKENMLPLMEGGMILPEVPLTDETNFLYVWK